MPMPKAKAKPRTRKPPRQIPFDAPRFLELAGPATRVTLYQTGQRIFSQGDAADTVIYIQSGTVRLSVVSKTGKEAVIAVLKTGDFFGEGCLAGHPQRMSSATAMGRTSILQVNRKRMAKLLHEQPELSDLFIAHMLDRNIRIEEDLVDQLFNSSEKRLARTLLLLARYGTEGQKHVLPKISQEVLAEMVGTTRSRVNFFMNRFRKMGLIDYNGGITVHNSLLTIVLHE